MQKHSFIFAAATALFLLAGAAYAAGPVLTVADVEKVGKLKGIKLVGKDPSAGAGGDLNFARADGTLVLMVALGSKSLLESMKAQKGTFKGPVAGIGDEAFNGPSTGRVLYLLAFRKGSKVASLSSYLDLIGSGKPFFNEAQLKELAKIAITRM